MQFEIYALLFVLDIMLFFCGFFGVPKQDRNTRTTLMIIVTILSFAMCFSSFGIEAPTGSVLTCTETVNYTYDCVKCATGCGNYTYDPVFENHTTICTPTTTARNDMIAVGLFFLLGVLGLLYTIMEMFGWLPSERTQGGLVNADRMAPKEFGQP